MGSIIARLGGAAISGGRAAIGNAARAVGQRAVSVSRWARNAVGNAIGSYAANRRNGGSGSNGNDSDEEFIQSGDNTSQRSTQLSAVSQPIELGGGFSEGPGKGGVFDPAITQILRSIDANIKAMRDSISSISANQNASRNYVPRASSMGRRSNFPGDYALTGLGLLGVGAGQVIGAGQQRPHETPGGPAPGEPHPNPPQGSTINPAPPAQQITEATGSTDNVLQQNLGLNPAPNNDVLSQAPTAQNRTAHIVDISQLRNSINQTRNGLQENNVNPRQNGVILRILSDAEGNLTELERLYNSQNPDMEAITDLRRQILERIQSARNFITPTPAFIAQPDARSVPEPSTPDATPAPEANTPGPQSSIDPSFVQTIINNRMEDYYQNYAGAVGGSKNDSNYFHTNSNNLTVSGSRNLTEANVISGNEDDNVAKRLEAIQVKNDATPIIIQTGGGESAPQVIKQSNPPQNNTPAPSPGAGDISIGYRSHPMLINEPRSPAFFSHP